MPSKYKQCDKMITKYLSLLTFKKMDAFIKVMAN